MKNLKYLSVLLMLMLEIHLIFLSVFITLDMQYIHKITSFSTNQVKLKSFYS